MRGRLAWVAVVCACAAAWSAFPATAQPSPDDLLREARERAALARADLNALLDAYRDAVLAAEEAAWRSYRARVDAELVRAAAHDTQRSFDDRIRRLYIEGPTLAIEAVLGSRTLDDLDARLPLAASSVAVGARDLAELETMRAEHATAIARAEEAQRAALAVHRRLDVVRVEISARLAAAESDVRRASAAVAAAAKARLATLRARVSGARTAADLAAFRIRHARAEAEFRAAAPFLGPRPDCRAPRGLRSTGERIAGEASWYGPGFAGKATATSALFDPKRYTVAHKTLPFGLFLLIRNDGKCVVAFLNDRGPYVGERILDLSAASAQAVDLSGVEWVEAELFVRAD